MPENTRDKLDLTFGERPKILEFQNTLQSVDKLT